MYLNHPDRHLQLPHPKTPKPHNIVSVKLKINYKLIIKNRDRQMPGEKKQQAERVVIPEKGDKKIDEARSK